MNYARQMVGDGDLVGAAILITRKQFQAEFDIPDLVSRLIDYKKENIAKNLVTGHPDLEREYINILITLKNIKGAVKAVKDFGLNPSDFPHLVEMACFNASNYFVSQVFRSPSHPDHIPLYKVEDLFSGDQVMIACLVTLLLKRWHR